MDSNGLLPFEKLVLSHSMTGSLYNHHHEDHPDIDRKPNTEIKTSITRQYDESDPRIKRIREDVEVLHRIQLRQQLSGFDLVTRDAPPDEKKPRELHLDSISSFVRVKGYKFSLGLKPTHVLPNHVYLYVQDYSCIKMAKQAPTLDDFKPADALVMVKNDKAGTLTAYRVNDGKIETRTLRQEDAGTILDRLPKTVESNESSNPDLSKIITQQFGCDSKHVLMETRAPNHPKDFPTSDTVVMVQDNKELTLTAHWVQDQEVRSRSLKLDDLKSTDIFSLLPKTVLSNKSHNPILIHDVASAFKWVSTKKDPIKYEVLNHDGHVETGDIALSSQKAADDLRSILRSKVPQLTPELEENLSGVMNTQGHPRYNQVWYYNKVSRKLLQIPLTAAELAEFDRIASGNKKLTAEQEASIFTWIPTELWPKQEVVTRRVGTTLEPVYDEESKRTNFEPKAITQQEWIGSKIIIGTTHEQLESEIQFEMRNSGLRHDITHKVYERYESEQALLVLCVRQELDFSSERNIKKISKKISKELDIPAEDVEKVVKDECTAREKEKHVNNEQKIHEAAANQAHIEARLAVRARQELDRRGEGADLSQIVVSLEQEFNAPKKAVQTIVQDEYRRREQEKKAEQEEARHKQSERSDTSPKKSSQPPGSQDKGSSGSGEVKKDQAFYDQKYQQQSPKNDSQSPQKLQPLIIPTAQRTQTEKTDSPSGERVEENKLPAADAGPGIGMQILQGIASFFRGIKNGFVFLVTSCWGFCCGADDDDDDHAKTPPDTLTKGQSVFDNGSRSSPSSSCRTPALDQFRQSTPPPGLHISVDQQNQLNPSLPPSPTEIPSPSTRVDVSSRSSTNSSNPTTPPTPTPVVQPQSPRQ